jgi:hypothetical protein
LSAARARSMVAFWHRRQRGDVPRARRQGQRSALDDRGRRWAPEYSGPFAAGGHDHPVVATEEHHVASLAGDGGRRLAWGHSQVSIRRKVFRSCVAPGVVIAERPGVSPNRPLIEIASHPNRAGCVTQESRKDARRECPLGPVLDGRTLGDAVVSNAQEPTVRERHGVDFRCSRPVARQRSSAPIEGIGREPTRRGPPRDGTGTTLDTAIRRWFRRRNLGLSARIRRSTATSEPAQNDNTPHVMAMAGPPGAGHHRELLKCALAPSGARRRVTSAKKVRSFPRDASDREARYR